VLERAAGCGGRRPRCADRSRALRARWPPRPDSPSV